MASTLVYLFFASVLLSRETTSFVVDGSPAPSSRLDALELMLAEEKQLRMRLENQMSALADKVTEMDTYQTDCGCQSKAAAIPAFMATLSDNLEHCTKHQTVVFDAVQVNTGGAYNFHHGVFTAPVAGNYHFASTLSLTPNNMFHTAIVKGNTSNAIAYLYADGSTIWRERSTSVITHLEAGDEVWMICAGDSRIEGNYNHGFEGAQDFHSHMSGFLISPEPPAQKTTLWT